MLFSRRLILFFSIIFSSLELIECRAAIFASAFFTGTIERFDEQTGAQSTFANISAFDPTFIGLSGIGYNPNTNELLVSGRFTNRIYRVNATTGLIIGSQSLAAGSAPAGIAVRNGSVYVSNFGLNTVSVFDSSWNITQTINVPNSSPNGLAFSGDDLLVSTFAGLGIVKYNSLTSAVTPFGGSPVANGQLAIGNLGDVFVGGAAVSNSIEKLSASGNALAVITVGAGTLPLPALSFASPDFTSPSGVAIDGQGNLIVAALGRTNPFAPSDNFQSNGGLFKYDQSGLLLSTFATQITPLSGVVVVSVPEPSSIALLSVIGLGFVWSRRRRRSLNA